MTDDKPVLWRNAFGEPVDLDTIDRSYALNILMMTTVRRAQMGWTRSEIEDRPLTKKLREVILTGRDPNRKDRARAMLYNIRCASKGLPFRAPTS